ncbi:MAG: hypothetical protein QXT68_06575 [Halobacteria archaeon]
MGASPALLLLLLLPSQLPSTLLESADPLTGEASRWEGWVGTVEVSGLPEGARVELADALGAPLDGSQANATGGRAILPVVSRLPGLFRVSVNGTPAADSLRLNGSFEAGPLLYFAKPGGGTWAEVCVVAVRNSAGRAIPNTSLRGIPVALGGAGARTNPEGCALLPAPAGAREAASLAGLQGPEVPAPSSADGLLFSDVEAGGQASALFERGFLRAIRISAASDLRNFTLVVEPRPGGGLAFWSRANSSGISRVFIIAQGPGTPRFCPQLEVEGCRWTPLQTLPAEGAVMAPLPGFGIIQMDKTEGSIYTATLAAIAAGAVVSALIIYFARRRRKEVRGPADIPRTKIP